MFADIDRSTFQIDPEKIREKITPRTKAILLCNPSNPTGYVYTPEELQKIPYRSKKELTGEVRLVEFPQADICACCGTHVERTGGIFYLAGEQTSVILPSIWRPLLSTIAMRLSRP